MYLRDGQRDEGPGERVGVADALRRCGQQVSFGGAVACTHFLRRLTSSSYLVTQDWILTLTMLASVSVSGEIAAAMAPGRYAILGGGWSGRPRVEASSGTNTGRLRDAALAGTTTLRQATNSASQTQAHECYGREFRSRELHWLFQSDPQFTGRRPTAARAQR